MVKVAVIVEYIWHSGEDTHHDIRSKCRTLYLDEALVDSKNYSEILAHHLPHWNFDGSSTAQARGANTEITIRPVGCYAHPFAKAMRSLAVLCECFGPDGEPTFDNSRAIARSVFDHPNAKPLEPWFGMEQEYVLVKKEGRPLGWPERGFPAAQGPYYCSNGPFAYGRNIVMMHYEKCLQMGLKISGCNAEVMPAQWEFQVGPCEGIEMGDQLILARWIYLRVLEDIGILGLDLDINFEAKPVRGDWNGSGCHTNFSTKPMREDGGIRVIEEAIDRLSKSVQRDIPFYGQENHERMTGKHETSKIHEFTWGVGTRNTSIRVGNDIAREGKGYLEDRRPSADIDPYLVSAALFSSACEVPAPKLHALIPHYYQSWMSA